MHYICVCAHWWPWKLLDFSAALSDALIVAFEIQNIAMIKYILTYTPEHPLSRELSKNLDWMLIIDDVNENFGIHLSGWTDLNFTIRNTAHKCTTVTQIESSAMREALWGVAQADKTGDRWVRLTDILYRLEHTYDKNIENRLDSKVDNTVVSR